MIAPAHYPSTRYRRLPAGTRLLLLASLPAAACAPWHATPLPPPGAAPAVERRDVRTRVVLRDGRRVEAWALAVDGDSLVGVSGPAWENPPRRFAVPMRDVVRVERADFADVRHGTDGIAIAIGALLVGTLAYGFWLATRL